MATRVEETIHPWRWRLLTIWIVVFSCLTAYALWSQRHDARRTDHRFCDVTTSFLTSEIQLRDQLNKGDLIEIGLRQSLEEASRNGVYVFGLAPPGLIQEPVRKAVLDFFQAIDDLEQAQVRLGQQALAQTDAFVDRLGRLRRALKCPN